MVEGKLWGAAKSGRQSFFVSAERLSIKSADRGNGAAAKQQVIIEGKAVTGQYEIEKKCSNLAIENPVAPVVVISRNAPESGIEGRINVTGRLGVTPEGKTFIEAEKIEPASAK